jgi:hypothetical protein
MAVRLIDFTGVFSSGVFTAQAYKNITEMVSGFTRRDRSTDFI